MPNGDSLLAAIFSVIGIPALIVALPGLASSGVSCSGSAGGSCCLMLTAAYVLLRGWLGLARTCCLACAFRLPSWRLSSVSA